MTVRERYPDEWVDIQVVESNPYLKFTTKTLQRLVRKEGLAISSTNL